MLYSYKWQQNVTSTSSNAGVASGKKYVADEPYITAHGLRWTYRKQLEVCTFLLGTSYPSKICGTLIPGNAGTNAYNPDLINASFTSTRCALYPLSGL